MFSEPILTVLLVAAVLSALAWMGAFAAVLFSRASLVTQ